MAEFNFREGEYVVYCSRGVGLVSSIDVQNIGGTDIKIMSISFPKDKMVVKVPLTQSNLKKLRKLCSKKEAQEVLESLKVPLKVKKIMWSRRAQEYELKINSGDFNSLAEVVRELHRTATQPEHSYSERQIYQEALGRLLREYALVAELNETQALENVEKALACAA